ncbi:fascin-like isoform X1 [Clytia hemisphaerica]
MAQTNGHDASNGIVFGLMNQQGKYLTAEKFGNQISVTGTSLRSKQLWTFEPEGAESSKGYLRSPQKNYLETTKTGTVTCEAEEKEVSLLFDVTVADDGRWAFKDSFGKFLAGNTERLYTTMDSKQADEYLWAIHIAGHPQCNMRSVSRKRFVHLKDDQLCANEDIPWGHDAVITLEFHRGKYAIRDSNGRYLNGESGELETTSTEECMFSIALQDTEFAFKSSSGKYLTVYGPAGKLIANKKAISRDELFALEQSKAQVMLTANNGKTASIKQGIDVTANQFLELGDFGDTETFQMEFIDGQQNQVTFLSKNKKYWTAGNKSVTSSADQISPECIFELEYEGDKIALKAHNDRYITSTSGGKLVPTGETTSDANTLFLMQLMNRPILVLRCEHGYVGLIDSNDKVQCNRGGYDAMLVEGDGQGRYRLKTSKGKSWKVDGTSHLVQSSDEGDLFLFELCSKNKMRIQASNGKYLKGDHNGVITASAGKDDRNILWEY